MSLREKLMHIQTEIKAPKNLYNKFGKYYYRNAEGICEAVKPYLAKENVALTLEDEIVAIADRVYVKATAILFDLESSETLSIFAYAREAEKKAGMDESQITGTASSYARKYALNGMFLLDDTKDADTDEHKEEQKAKEEQQKFEEEAKKNAKKKISETKIKALVARCEADKVPHEKILTLYKVSSFADLTEEKYYNINQFWEKIKGE